jgi:glycosyltransferase involved in cell wall biosynthesis
VLWVAGDRQAQFARKLGYSGAKLWHGLYCCDWGNFSYLPTEIDDSKEKSFLYVGRYNAQEKALDLLVNAYTQYRNKVQQPWKLTCAGAGEMKQLLAGQTGIVDMGFTQPDALPALMRVHGAFILPSRKEPWGVVLQEAAASSLPLICSDACGASVHLLQDGYNGFVFGSDDIAHLAQCMVKMTELNNKERSEMGRRSHELARQFTPQRWAATLIQGLLDYS